MWHLGQKEIEWKEDVYLTTKITRQKLGKQYAEVTPTTGMLLIDQHIHDSFWILPSFRKSGNWMHDTPEDKIFDNTQCHECLSEV